MSLALLAAAVAPGWAQPRDAAPDRAQNSDNAGPNAAQPSETAVPGRQPASENPAPSRPDSPFAEVFAQLSGRLVGVVVNIATRAPAPAKRSEEHTSEL